MGLRFFFCKGVRVLHGLSLHSDLCFSMIFWWWCSLADALGRMSGRSLRLRSGQAPRPAGENAGLRDDASAKK
jgi:hypothetical protein